MRPGHLRLTGADAAELRDSLASAASAAGLSAIYPQDALDDALAAVAEYRLPDIDLRHIPFITIDPEGSTDLDQALWLEPREGGGWHVLYAIADVPHFVRPDGPLDAQTRLRAETAYLPQGRIPLHPAQISEDAGSLLPGKDRGAYVWDLAVLADGTSSLTSLTLCTVRSVEQLSYPEAQRRLEAGDQLMVLLHHLGEARRVDESRRGGANLGLPEHEVEPDGDNAFVLITRDPLPIEEDNAQVSLMTGMAAAQVMLAAGVGLLRTMPAPDEGSENRFRAVTRGLGHPWSKDMHYGDYLRTLDVADPRQLAIMHAAGSLFRGAAYTPFDGAQPEITEQAAVGAPYAHTTAPLRRLVDRFALVLCHAHLNGLPIPDYVRSSLPQLPELMKAGGGAVNSAERASLDIVEASILSQHVGEEFDAVVVDGRTPGKSDAGHKAPSVKVILIDPPVEARAVGAADSGTTVRVRVRSADVATGSVELDLVAPTGG